MNHEHRYSEDRPKRARANPLWSILLVLAGVALGAAAFWASDHFRFHSPPPLTDPAAQLRQPSPKSPLDAEEHEAIDVFKKARPSVVNVDIVRRGRTGWDDRLIEQQTATGSGFIWDDDGRIVTNYHVIAPLGRRSDLIARVVLADRSAYDAVLVGAAPDYDLAVLQFAPHNLPPRQKLQKIDLGTSTDLEVGQKAFAIGNPFGLSLTMTKGIISALDQTIESPAGTPIPGVIQTDAPINPGNSGGPLLDKSGRLIGVNTAITSPSVNGGNVGIGFAIPADTVNQVVTQVIQSGRALRPELGIKLYDQRKLRQARYDTGVMIEQTAPGGPADTAGLRGIRRNPRTGRADPGDLIIALNSQPIDSVEDYEREVRKLKPGDSVKLKIVRDEAEQEVTLTVGGA